MPDGFWLGYACGLSTAVLLIVAALLWLMRYDTEDGDAVRKAGRGDE